MIEVKLQFPDAAALVAFFTANNAPGAVAAAANSATITPEKQAAAIESAKAGTAGKATGKPKAETKPPETPLDALKQAVTDEKAADPKPARTYESSGLAEKIAKGAAKDRAKTTELLIKHKAVNAEGKPSGKALPVENFDAFEKDIDALLAPAEDLG